jgi:hypothetical protein
MVFRRDDEGRWSHYAKALVNASGRKSGATRKPLIALPWDKKGKPVEQPTIATVARDVAAEVQALREVIAFLRRQDGLMREILAELQREPSGELGETLKALIGAVDANTASNQEIKTMLLALPGEVVRAVSRA